MSTPTNTFTKKCYVILNKKFYGLFSYFFNTLWWNCFIRYTFCSFYILVLIFANLSLKMYSVFNLRKMEIFLPWHYAVHLVAPPLLILLAWHFLKRLLLQVTKKKWKTNKSESFVKSSTKRTLYTGILFHILVRSFAKISWKPTLKFNVFKWLSHEYIEQWYEDKHHLK